MYSTILRNGLNHRRAGLLKRFEMELSKWRTTIKTAIRLI